MAGAIARPATPSRTARSWSISRRCAASRWTPGAGVAWAEPGLTAGEYTRAAAAHGLATPFGDTASVGIAGITLSGGIGFLARKHGLTIDHLVSVELVTADGSLLAVSETSHPDLFWAVRGGGGNFGIVTRLQYALQPVDLVLGGALFLPATRDVLRGLVPIAASAPEELTTIALLMPAPPLPFIPAEAHGRPTVAILMVYAGDVEDGQRAVAPFRALARPIADVVRPMPYPAIYELTAEAGRRTPSVQRSLLLDALEDAKVDTILARMAAPSSPLAMTQIRVLGGAMARVPNAATAFGHRGRSIMVTVITPFADVAERDRHVAWTQDYADALGLHDAGAYAGFLDDEGEARVRSAYPAATYARLAEIKRRYDPDNVFRANQNIVPGVVRRQDGASGRGTPSGVVAPGHGPTRWDAAIYPDADVRPQPIDPQPGGSRAARGRDPRRTQRLGRRRPGAGAGRGRRPAACRSPRSTLPRTQVLREPLWRLATAHLSTIQRGSSWRGSSSTIECPVPRSRSRSSCCARHAGGRPACSWRTAPAS